MENRKLIAEALLEVAQRAETIFLEVGKEDTELIDTAKKFNIELPSPDLMVMKTVYAEIDKVNKNGVILPKKAVEEGLKTLIGKQCNWEHDGAGFVCGYTISAKITGDKIETINVLFKSLFPTQAEELKEKIKQNKAAVSFEIWNINPDSKESVVKILANGFKEISPITFHGTGILLVHEPACPKAKIFKLIAQKEINEAEKIIDKVFSEDLIFAQLAIEEPKCKNCVICNCEKEDNRVELLKLFEIVKAETDVTFELAMAFYYASEEEQKSLTEDAAKWTRKFINDLPDSAFAAIEPAYPEKIEDKNCRHLPHHTSEGDLGKDKSNENLDLSHYKNALARVNQIQPVSDSISAEELRSKASAHLERHRDVLEKSEEQISEETKTEVKTEETKTEAQAIQKIEEPVVETKSVETNVEETKETLKVEAEIKVGEQTEEKIVESQPIEQIEPKIIVKVTRIYSEVVIDTYVDGTPSGTNEVKGFNKKITEYNDGTKDEVEEVVEIKKKFDFSEVEQKINEAKSELDKEIKKLQEELGKKDQEIAKLTPKVEEKKEKDLTVGAVETEKQSELKKQAQNINKIIASKHNQ